MFTTDLKVKSVDNDRWELTSMLKYVGINSIPVMVPKGFIVGLITIPQPFRAMLSISSAIAVHEWLYYKKGHSLGSQYTRKECDMIFLEAMESSGVNYVMRYSLYWAVRLCGYDTWSN